MFIVWFNVSGKWHWIECYFEETAQLTREVLKLKGYKVTETSHNPNKTSAVNTQQENK